MVWTVKVVAISKCSQFVLTVTSLSKINFILRGLVSIPLPAWWTPVRILPASVSRNFGSMRWIKRNLSHSPCSLASNTRVCTKWAMLCPVTCSLFAVPSLCLSCLLFLKIGSPVKLNIHVNIPCNHESSAYNAVLKKTCLVIYWQTNLLHQTGHNRKFSLCQCKSERYDCLIITHDFTVFKNLITCQEWKITDRPMDLA